ncbi:MAG: hypothetical protein KZQ94_01510 [Candidatus Thiodiazotropha sp. (ex Troendleina suluensis)]|nr:hypothetical protein [Candidatus Thiodiazotropha sp. (ex Troendleina suluensis)]
MVNNKRLHLLIPGLFWSAAIKQLSEESIQLKALKNIIAKADKRIFQATDLSAALFQLFAIEPGVQRELPLGAVTLHGMGIDPEKYCWALATPVYLLADRDRLILLKPDEQVVSQQDSDQLTELFNNYFEEDGLSLIAVSPTEWFIRVPYCPDLTTFTMEAVVGRHIEDYLPKGPDAKNWRKFLNEIQMLFFHSELNQQKSITGEAVINSLWFSGFGTLPKVSTSLTSIYSDLPLVKGLAMLSGVAHYDQPDRLDELVDTDGDILIVISDLLDYELKSDFYRWKESLLRIDEGIYNLFRKNKSKNDIELYVCDGEKFCLKKPKFSWRLWIR